MFGFLRSGPEYNAHSPQHEIAQRYRYWRFHIMVNMYIGYVAFYLTRKSFNYAAPDMIADLGLDKSDIGLMSTAYYITYGLSKFFSGILSDQSNPRYFMGIGLIMTGIINIFFGLAQSLPIFIALWVGNAFFQGWGWPACSKLLTTWYARSERGLFWAIWNTTHNVGAVVIYLMVIIVATHDHWRNGFIVPGIIAIVVGLILTYRLRDKPTTLGLPTIGQWRQDPIQLEQENYKPNLSFRDILLHYVLENKYLWLLGSSYILVYIVMVAINDWGNLYLIEQKGYDLTTANATLTLFELGGFIGCLVAGWGSDVVFKGNRGPMNLIYSIGIFMSVTALWVMPLNDVIFQATLFFCLGFFVCGPQMLIGMAAVECSHKNAAGAATGFVGLFAYIGASIAGYPLALVLDKFHWNAFFAIISLCAAGIGLLLLPFLQAQFPAHDES
ncbi:MFS transporter family glucose-6-phosphate receptor UhpC [Celerinatantimonas sp. YJH-8]|uniref:MFS transporter family glucose-6-phosphate receptor UhpC n=1 Tax=Celerinatantimonas sp. YJH-8 TaxID=3228714 RepID=UPI0038C1A945